MSVVITIRDVPEDVRNTLASRAAAQGQSLQQFMRQLAIDTAARPTLQDVIERARARVSASGSRIAPEATLAALRTDRR
jgi:plasmid stability protein